MQQQHTSYVPAVPLRISTPDPWPSEAAMIATFSWAWQPARDYPAAKFKPTPKPKPQRSKPIPPETLLARSPIYHPQPKRQWSRREAVRKGEGRIVREVRTVGPLTYRAERYIPYHGLKKLYHRALARYKNWRAGWRTIDSRVRSSGTSRPVF